MRNLVSQIIEFGEVRRGVLGVTGLSVNGEIAKAMELETNQGGFVEQVTKDSAAEEAGIKAGDVITKVNGKRIKSFSELRGKIGSIGAGKDVKITVITREGKERTYTATLKKPESPKLEAVRLHEMLDGANLENLEGDQGVVVTAVEEDTAAQYVGLQPDLSLIHI